MSRHVHAATRPEPRRAMPYTYIYCPSAGGVTTNWPHDHRGTKPAESRTTSKRGEAPSGANEKQARKSARQDIFMTRNFTRIKIRHTERRMNSLEIRRDEVKDTKSRAQKQTFMFDYAETMYLRYSQRYGKCGGLQIFHRRHAGFRSRSHLLYDRKREYPIEKRRFTGRTHENAGLAVQKIIEVIREGIRFRTSTVLKS